MWIWQGWTLAAHKWFCFNKVNRSEVWQINSQFLFKYTANNMQGFQTSYFFMLGYFYVSVRYVRCGLLEQILGWAIQMNWTSNNFHMVVFVWSPIPVSILISFKVCKATHSLNQNYKGKRKKKHSLFWIRNNLATRCVQTFWNGLVEFIVKFRMGEGRVQADSL